MSLVLFEDGLLEQETLTVADQSQPSPKGVFIETLGCQMNKADSELMLGLLNKKGFMPVAEPEMADLVIINTCQIREHAEDKAYGYLGRWGKLKRSHPDIKIAMAGCVAQQTAEGVFKRAPYVDIVFGTQNIHELPQLVEKVSSKPNAKAFAVDRQRTGSTYDYFSDVTPIRQESNVSAWVTIIEGCDYFCTYCVVPYTRGRQISRKPESILEEVEQLAESGYKEITILGQTVDAYGKDFTDRKYDLANLLEALNNVPGIERIRFMTSHPLDLTDNIIHAIADLPHVMEFIHMPMQAGDDDILDRMRRGYTAKQYYDLIDKIYDRIPNVAISGDYIVGFPGETDEQFKRTVESVYRARKHSANSAAYSARRQTPAGIWEERGEGVIPTEVKKERLQILNEAITDNALKMNQPYLNQVAEILVEGPSKRNPNRLMGRTRTNKVVNFDIPSQLASSIQPGHLLPVHITEVNAWSLLGQYEAPRLA